MCHMGGRRKTINCTVSGSGSGSRSQARYGSGAEACICILMPPRTGPQQSQRGKSKQMRLQTVKMAAQLGQAREAHSYWARLVREGSLIGSRRSVNALHDQPGLDWRVALFRPCPYLIILCVCLEVFPCYAHSADFCFASVCVRVCV